MTIEGQEPTQEIPEGIATTTVKEELYQALMETDIQSEPDKYMDLLDAYEQEDLREKQVERREKVNEKLKLNG